MKSILMIDPNDTEEYIYGLLKALNKSSSVILITKKNSRISIDGIDIKKWFYEDTTRSKLYAGLNYIWTYVKILFLVFKKKIDVVHIQWFKLEVIDFYFVKLLKGMSLVVHTAHNVLPHVNGEKKEKQYRRLYNEVDKIVVHGQAIKKELSTRMAIAEVKIDIQPYGFADMEEFPIDENSDLLTSVDMKRKQYDRIYLAIGLINSYKGTDRLLNIWNKQLYDTKTLLVVAGKVDEKTSELENALDHLASNVLYCNKKLSGYEFDYLCKKADMIILPYRTASMSGVVFSAARANTTVLTTKVGTIPEYLVNMEDSIIVDNNNKAIAEGICLAETMSLDQLSNMGQKLRDNFEHKFKWDVIVEKLLKNTYEK